MEYSKSYYLVYCPKTEDNNFLDCGTFRICPLSGSFVCLLRCACPLKLKTRHDLALIYFISIRLGSSLAPNGLHISVTKRGGYDLCRLDTGMILHTFAHDLPLAILDGDKYPSTFLLEGSAFCGATVDGEVTLWDVEVGNRVLGIRHLRESTSSAMLMALILIYVCLQRVQLSTLLQYVSRPLSPSRLVPPQCRQQRRPVLCSSQRQPIMKSEFGRRYRVLQVFPRLDSFHPSLIPLKLLAISVIENAATNAFARCGIYL